MHDRINYNKFIYNISDEIYVHSIFITLLKLSAPDLSKNIYEYHPMLLDDFVQLTQKPEAGWLRKPDQNRWSSKIDSDKQIENIKFKKIIQSLNFFHPQPLMEETYDYIVVLGTSIPNLAKRFFHLATLLKTKAQFQHICLMGSDQDVTSFKPSLEKIVELYPDKFKTNPQIPEILTEHGAMEFFIENIKEFSKEKIPEIIKLPSPVKVLDGRVVKPTTNDELNKLNSYLGMRKTHLGKIAIISHAPFHYRQNLIFLSMTDKYQIETTAPDDTLHPRLNELSGSTISQQIALDELARLFYQLHQLSLTNRDILYKNMASPKIYYNKKMYDLIIPYPNIKTFSFDEIRNQQERCKVYNYVVTEDRDLIISDQYAVIESSIVHYAYEFTVKHPYLTNYRGVLAAGEVTVIRDSTNKKDAIIKSIDNKSGHLRPESNFLVAESAESAFVENGFNEAQGTFQFREQARELCLSIPPGPSENSITSASSKQTAGLWCIAASAASKVGFTFYSFASMAYGSLPSPSSYTKSSPIGSKVPEFFTDKTSQPVGTPTQSSITYKSQKSAEHLQQPVSIDPASVAENALLALAFMPKIKRLLPWCKPIKLSEKDLTFLKKQQELLQNYREKFPTRSFERAKRLGVLVDQFSDLLKLFQSTNTLITKAIKQNQISSSDMSTIVNSMKRINKLNLKLSDPKLSHELRKADRHESLQERRLFQRTKRYGSKRTYIGIFSQHKTDIFESQLHRKDLFLVTGFKR